MMLVVVTCDLPGFSLSQKKHTSKNCRKPCSIVFSGGSLAGEISNELKVGTEDWGRMMSSNSFNVMIVLNVYHLETHEINLQTSHFRMMWFGGAPCWRRYW